ncbi:MAG: hypothetical protein ACE3JQ_09915 [Paenisporosarcina sp.]
MSENKFRVFTFLLLFTLVIISFIRQDTLFAAITFIATTIVWIYALFSYLKNEKGLNK